jgi:hypothetical protein
MLASLSAATHDIVVGGLEQDADLGTANHQEPACD